MLTAIRSKTSSWVIKILFALLVASFAVWGIGDIFRAPSQQSAAIEVGDVAISGQQVAEEFNRDVDNLRRALGGPIEPEQARQMGVLDQTVGRLVRDALLIVETQRLGLAVPDEMIRDRIQSQPAFRNDAGQFDRSLFTFVLQREGYTEDRYVTLLRNGMAQEQMLSALTSGIKTPGALVEAIHSYRSETRVAKTLVLPLSSVPEPADPGEEKLKAHYEEHKDAYMAPEYRALTLVRLSPSELAKGIEIGEDRLREAYEAQKAQLEVPEKRHIRQFVLSDEAAAKAAADRLKSEAFEQVAKDTTGADPIDLGTIPRSELLPELADPAFTAPEGTVAGPVESPLGWHVMRIEKIDPLHMPTFEDVRETLRQQIATDQAVEETIALANKLDDALAGGAGLDEAAEQLNVPAEKIEAVDQSGNAPNGSRVEAIRGDATLLAMAFGTEEGETTTQTELQDGSYAIMRIDSLQAAAPRPFENVRADVLKDWTQAERDRALKEKADGIAEQARGGKSLETLATELSLTVKMSAPFTRQGDDAAASVTPPIASSLFSLQRGEVTTGPGKDGHVVAQLAEITPPEPLKPEEKTALETDLQSAIGEDLRDQYIGALRQEIDVTVDQAVIDTLFQ